MTRSPADRVGLETAPPPVLGKEIHLHPSGNRPAAHPSLVDNHGRSITYLRLAVTDRCNLRCRYCMPARGVRFVPYEDILRYEELVRLVHVFADLGISKVRITGGEPFARRDILPFLKQVKSIKGIDGLYITTNGIAMAEHLDALREMGISGINLSLDTLDPGLFRRLTGKDRLDRVMATLHGCLKRKIPLKINTVILDDTSDKTIRDIAGLARQYPLAVRFIEKMPFSGGNGVKNSGQGQLQQRLARLFSLERIQATQPSTACLFKVPGFTGTLGIIEGHSRKFCATCNKLRVTPLGILKTCLYDSGVLDLKTMLRSSHNDTAIAGAVLAAVGKRHADGRQAEELCGGGNEPSMASIGG